MLPASLAAQPSAVDALLQRAEEQIRIDPQASALLAQQALAAAGPDGPADARVRALLMLCEHEAERDRSAAQAEAHVRGLLEPHLAEGDAVEVVDVADAAMPAVDHPLLHRLIQARGLEVRAGIGTWGGCRAVAAAFLRGGGRRCSLAPG